MNAICRMAIPTLLVCSVVFGASSARAGWIVVKNDTNSPVVLQEVSDAPNGKRGKIIRLLPGEVHREYRAGSGDVKLEVLDPKMAGKTLCAERIMWGVKDALYNLQLEAKTQLWSLVKPIAKVVDMGPPASTAKR